MRVSRRVHVRVQDRMAVAQNAVYAYSRAASWNRDSLAERPGGMGGDGGN